VLEIRVLGGLDVIRDGASVALPPSRKTRALLGYLALSRGPHRREQLCEMFWDVPDDPRGALRWSLSKIRPLVDEPSSPRLLADRQSIELRTDAAAVDFLAVEVCAGAKAASAEALAGAAHSVGHSLQISTCPRTPVSIAGYRASARMRASCRQRFYVP
jgi:DNA-binding SARP family transcriptional activator